ncbi:MAG TPA: class I SAM-dependent methyltransferase [Sphingobium sp.]|nr:class I SAM-dependent methyltransferase [Sphingobium sp.]
MRQIVACPICRSDKIAFRYDGRSNRNLADRTVWPIFNCENCGHGFMNPQPSWEELQPYYNPAYEPYQEDHGFQEIDREVEEARQTGELRHIKITRNMRLLDIGCGGGAFLRRAQALGAQVQGVEPSDHGYATAVKSGVPVYHGQTEGFLEAYPDRKFDVVTSNHVIEHHPAPVDLLKSMAKALADGGYIWFAVPNAGCLSSRRLDWRWHSSDLPFHLMQFTPQSVRETLELAGLTVRRLYTYTFPPAGLASFRAELRYRFLIPRKLTTRLPLARYAARRARRLDGRGEGEAIVIEATA